LKFVPNTEVNPSDYAHIRTALNELSLLEEAHNHKLSQSQSQSQSLSSLSSLSLSLISNHSKSLIHSKQTIQKLKLISLDNISLFLELLFENLQFLWPRLKK
jgi:hypothetical protein